MFKPEKSSNKDLINLIASVMELTLKDYEWDELQIGQFRYRFVQNLSKIMSLMVTNRMKIKDYD